MRTLIAAFLLVPVVALGANFDRITVSGQLKTVAGTAPDGVYNFTVSLYAAETGGDPL